MAVKKATAMKPRMAKSANVERDSGEQLFEGYIPTGRVLDIVQRIAVSMKDPTAGRAFSITGPYGSGKSSFAVFLNALFDSPDSVSYKAAYSTLAKTDARLAKEWVAARKAFVSAEPQVTRAFATANREALATTLTRALESAPVVKPLPSKTVKATKATTTAKSRTPAARKSKQPLIDKVSALARMAPLVLLIDEFGKNLEAFGEAGAAGDPYLLQQIAELSQGADALPIILITMQHLAFDEYVLDAGTSQRREWAKVQGRFHDVGFVDSPEQSFVLIASTFNTPAKPLKTKIDRWYVGHKKELDTLGLSEVVKFAKDSYPLHPATLSVLPELCSRFGQNERTLFSFLAGAEPGALPDIIAGMNEEKLSFVGLDALYNYFVESAGSFIGASHSASRWIEIETRIRDASGFNTSEVSLLKSIGILNLLTAGGSLRASKDLLHSLWKHGELVGDFDAALSHLESRGFVTLRDFADEYRIWSGSDFNLRAAVETERRILVDLSDAELITQVVQLDPVVAGRHSQSTGVLRVLPRVVVGGEVSAELIDTIDETFDGVILLAQGKLPTIEKFASTKPVVVAQARNDVHLRDAALEVESVRRVLESLKEDGKDWVAIQEMSERLAFADQELAALLEEYWNPRSTQWFTYEPKSGFTVLPASRNLSALVSVVCDQSYSATPRIANEMIARRELTSQGAKARRTLVDALFESADQELLNLEGYGPARAIYESTLRAPGFHTKARGESSWTITAPKAAEWKAVWKVLDRQLQQATSTRISLADFASPLKLPPYGLKDGVTGLLTAVYLRQHIDDVAFYEYGTLVLKVDDAVIERMLKNPEVFSIRDTGVSQGQRAEVIAGLRERLQMPPNAEASSFLQVARALFRELRSVEPFTQQTGQYLSDEARSVREAFKVAVEPDTLIFVDLPEALGLTAFPASKSKASAADAQAFANRLVDALLELKGAYTELIDRIESGLAQSLASGSAGDTFRDKVHGQAVNVMDSILQPKLKSFAFALSREDLDYKAWLENIAMVVSDGVPPRTWTDENEGRFNLLLSELGANFRRLQALLYERLASSEDGFESRRVTVTWPDGREISEAVALSQHEMSVVDETMGDSVKKLAEVFGSDFDARKALAAWLWIDSSSVQADQDAPRDRKDVSGE